MPAAKKKPAKKAAPKKPETKKSAESNEDESAKPYQPRRTPLQNAGLDQDAAEEQRQAELAEERKVHNERTGDPSVR